MSYSIFSPFLSKNPDHMGKQNHLGFFNTNVSDFLHKMSVFLYALLCRIRTVRRIYWQAKQARAKYGQ